MKKIILVILFGLILSTSASYAADQNMLQTKEATLAARGEKIASREAMITKNQTAVSEDLRNRAQKEINRRVEFLTQLITQINGIKKLTVAQKTDLQSQIQVQIVGLNTLQAKINADTDNVTLKADVKSIINNYYVFLFFREKVNLLVAADKISATSDNLSGISIKLQTRISQAQTAGNNVTTLNAQLLNMNAKISDAKIQIASVQTEVSILTAQGYPGNKTTLQDARSKIKLANQDLKVAYQDALKIRDGLKEQRIKTPEASGSAH